MCRTQSVTFYLIFVTVLINGGTCPFMLDWLDLRQVDTSSVLHVLLPVMHVLPEPWGGGMGLLSRMACFRVQL